MNVYLSTLKLHRYSLTIVSAAENYFVQRKRFWGDHCSKYFILWHSVQHIPK